jgi:23S rRNA (uridine2552-2'-O)-methyltransferase
MARREDRSRADSWTKRAKKQGYGARSVFKLEDLDRRFSLLRPGTRVLDLGCHPGSWLQYATERVGPTGYVVGIDRTATTPFGPSSRTIVGDIYDTPIEELDPEGQGFHTVLSDMAPDTTGVRNTDQARSAALAEHALSLATQLLLSGGGFACKVFQGPDVHALVQAARAVFDKARLTRPPAVRKKSTEVYLVATGFQGAQTEDA